MSNYAANVLGVITFYDPDMAIGLSIATAGYPMTSTNPFDPSARTMVTSSGTIVGKIGSLFTYSDTVDTESGQSGSGVWIRRSALGANSFLSEIKGDLIAAVHVQGGPNAGEQITPDAYRTISEQIERDAAATGNTVQQLASALPENAIVGTEKGFFSFITGSGNDFIEGTFRRELVLGVSGDDRIEGGGGDDRIFGGEGTDQALFGDVIKNYTIRVVDPAKLIFEVTQTAGAKTDAKDRLDSVEFAVFEFTDTNGNGVDRDGDLFFVPLQVDPDDNTKLKDGPGVTHTKNVVDSNQQKIGTATVDLPAFMFDGDVRYTFNLGAENTILYNFVYIVDSSGSMTGNNIAQTKSAYQALTQELIQQGVAQRSNFAVVDFDDGATLFSGLDAAGAIAAVNSLVAGGGTNFGPALNEAERWFEGLSNVKSATNIAFFLSDGMGNGASASLQLVNEGTANEAVIDVRAFGIGAGADLSSLNIIDSNNAVLLQNPADLIDAFSVSGIDKSKITRIDVKVAGVVVDTITPNELVDGPLGLVYEGTLNSLVVTREAENKFDFVIIFNDGTPQATVSGKITTGQKEVRQQSSDGTKVVVTFAVNQSNYRGNNESEEINANDIANTISTGGGTNTVRGNGGGDRITISGGTNVVDGGEGVDTAVFTLTKAQAGNITKTGDLVSVGNNTFVNVEFIEFSDGRIATNSLQSVPLATVSASPTVSESTASGGSTKATFVVTLSSAITQDVTVSFKTRSDSAVAGSDFTARNSSVVILAGRTTATFDVSILDGLKPEGDEVFLVDLNLSAGATFANGASRTTVGARIADNDTAIDVAVVGDQFTFAEGNPGTRNTQTFTLVRTGDVSGEDRVKFAVTSTGANSATAADFVGGLPSGEVIFLAGEATKAISVRINNDSLRELDETFALTLTQSTGNAMLPSKPVVFTILNDDLGNQAPTITSNGGSATATVSIQENKTAVTKVVASDADAGTTLRYTLIGGPDSGLFAVNSKTGSLSFKTAPNFEAPADAGKNNVYNVVVQVSDGLLTDAQSLAIMVTNLLGEITGTNRQDVLFGSNGVDFVNALSGNDLVNTRAGGDVIRAGRGNDVVFTGAGNDIAYGGAGDDRLDGDLGADKLYGETGNDIIKGGAGADRFNFSKGFGRDTILDFAQGDVIALSLSAAYDSFAEVRAKTRQIGADVVFTADASNSITLKNVLLRSIEADALQFV